MATKPKKLEKEIPQNMHWVGKQMQNAERQLLFLHTLQRWLRRPASSRGSSDRWTCPRRGPWTRSSPAPPAGRWRWKPTCRRTMDTHGCQFSHFAAKIPYQLHDELSLSFKICCTELGLNPRSLHCSSLSSLCWKDAADVWWKFAGVP